MNQVKPKIVHIVQLHVLEYPHQDHVHPPPIQRSHVWFGIQYRISHVVQLYILEYPHQEDVCSPPLNAHMSDLVSNAGFHMAPLYNLKQQG